MNYKKVMKQIDKYLEEARENLDTFKLSGNNKYLLISEECMIEADELLNKIKIEVKEEKENEQLQ